METAKFYIGEIVLYDGNPHIIVEGNLDENHIYYAVSPIGNARETHYVIESYLKKLKKDRPDAGDKVMCANCGSFWVLRTYFKVLEKEYKYIVPFNLFDPESDNNSEALYKF